MDFDNLEFPVSVVFRFSMEPGFTYGSLFATDEGLGYSGLAFYCGLEGVESFIGDGFGSGPEIRERRSKLASFYISKLVNGTLLLELFVEQRTIPFSSTDLIWEDTILAMEMENSFRPRKRPATIGYFVLADSKRMFSFVGQEITQSLSMWILWAYMITTLALWSREFGNSCFQDSGSMDSLGVQVGALAWYDFDAENPFKDSSSNQPDIVADGNVQSEVVLCVCENSVEIAVTIQETGCTDAEA